MSPGQHLLELLRLSDGGVAAHHVGAWGLQVLQHALGEDGDAGVPPVEGGDVAKEALLETGENGG